MHKIGQLAGRVLGGISRLRLLTWNWNWKELSRFGLPGSALTARTSPLPFPVPECKTCFTLEKKTRFPSLKPLLAPGGRTLENPQALEWLVGVIWAGGHTGTVRLQLGGSLTNYGTFKIHSSCSLNFSAHIPKCSLGLSSLAFLSL